MSCRSSIGRAALTMALLLTSTETRAFDETKYPNLKGQWVRARIPGVTGAPSYDPTKPQGLAQQAPLKPEFQAILEANIKEQAAGGQAGDPTYMCLSPGMPRVMIPYRTMEIVITPETTHFLIEDIHDSRRVFTDGRDWPTGYMDPTLQGYSLGQWHDTDGDGRYDTLEVETRHLKGPRAYDATGIPFHPDNQTIIKERIHWNKNDPDVLTDEITTIDNALTRPWTVTRTYRREQVEQPEWIEEVCTENNNHVEIAGQNYFLSADGRLMPTQKGQEPPDLRYFNQSKK